MFSTVQNIQGDILYVQNQYYTGEILTTVVQRRDEEAS
jgi:hypothetical protein